MHCFRWENYSEVTQNSRRADVLLLSDILSILLGKNLTFENKSVPENLFRKSCYCWNNRIFYVRLAKNSPSIESLVLEARNWASYFATQEQLKYKKYYMTLPENYGHILAKNLAMVRLLDKDQLHLCIVTSRDFSFVFPYNFSCICHSTPSTFETVCLVLHKICSR